MKMRTTARIGLISLLASITIGVNVAYRTTNLFDSSHIEVTVKENGKERKIEIPRYNSVKIGKLQCAKYARMVSLDVFGEEYPNANAWDMRHEVKETRSVSKNNIDKLIEDGEIKPGTIVGFSYPDSTFLNNLDSLGNPVKYTHLGTYIGQSFNGPLFAHQFKGKNEVVSLNTIYRYNMSPEEVIVPPERKIYASKK